MKCQQHSETPQLLHNPYQNVREHFINMRERTLYRLLYRSIHLRFMCALHKNWGAHTQAHIGPPTQPPTHPPKHPNTHPPRPVILLQITRQKLFVCWFVCPIQVWISSNTVFFLAFVYDQHHDFIFIISESLHVYSYMCMSLCLHRLYAYIVSACLSIHPSPYYSLYVDYRKRARESERGDGPPDSRALSTNALTRSKCTEASLSSYAPSKVSKGVLVLLPAN